MSEWIFSAETEKFCLQNAKSHNIDEENTGYFRHTFALEMITTGG